MTEDENTVEAKVIDTLRFALAMMCFVWGGLLATFFLALRLDLHFIGVIGFLVFFILPLVYIKPFRNLFTKNVKIIFNEDQFIIEFSGINDDLVTDRISYQYKIIESCTLNSQRNNYSTLILLFNNGRSKRYTFYDEGESVNSSEIVYQKIVSFKKRVKDNPSIKLSPSFYASKSGTILITILGVITFFILIFQLIYPQKYLLISFLTTISLFVGIIFKRINDIKRMNDNNKDI